MENVVINVFILCKMHLLPFMRLTEIWPNSQTNTWLQYHNTITSILSHLAYVAECVISKLLHSLESARKADVNCHCKWKSVMGLDRMTTFWCLKDVTNTHNCMQNSPPIGRILQRNGKKLEEAKDLKCVFVVCVRIEIDQLQCVNCWVIIHCLSVSCTKTNQSPWTFVIWSLQATFKQWIITQQFTARADLFLKYTEPHFYCKIKQKL